VSRKGPPVIEDLRAAGITSLGPGRYRCGAQRAAFRPRGGTWSATQVRRVQGSVL
jgi:hypothetical protein